MSGSPTYCYDELVLANTSRLVSASVSVNFVPSRDTTESVETSLSFAAVLDARSGTGKMSATRKARRDAGGFGDSGASATGVAPGAETVAGEQGKIVPPPSRYSVRWYPPERLQMLALPASVSAKLSIFCAMLGQIALR